MMLLVYISAILTTLLWVTALSLIHIFTGILEAIENDRAYDSMECQKLETGVHVLTELNKDTTDRNRTSPLAFTGNKFAFRSLGSAISIACPNIMLNTCLLYTSRCV